MDVDDNDSFSLEISHLDVTGGRVRPARGETADHNGANKYSLNKIHRSCYKNNRFASTRDIE